VGLKPFMPVCLRIDQWMACSLGLETRKDWIAWAHGSKAVVESGHSPVMLPPILRRRVSALGQMAFKAAGKLSVPESVRFIFCSRHGEFIRTLGILIALAAGEPVSPAEFSLAVHNALAGLLSIASRNTAGHTAIAAGADSFRSALIEASSCLMERPDQPVLLVYSDDSLPDPYAEIADSDEICVALAILLTSPRHNTRDVNARDVVLELPPPGIMAKTAESASGQALAFIRFLLTEKSEERPGGERAQWRWLRG
jgi:hypothetical protein